jgi:hypothetical protein
LALRICNLQSKSQYKNTHDFLKQNGNEVLQPPGKLTKLEDNYMPATCHYTIQSIVEGDDYHHTPIKSMKSVEQHVPEVLNIEPLDIQDGTSEKLMDEYVTNCKGVRWPYADALAKTLEELNDEVETGMKENGLDPTDQEVLFRVTVKDGADGMGSVSQYKEVADKNLPDNAFRYTFAITKIVAESDEAGSCEVYNCKNPNSVQTNRPLLESIADENGLATMSLIMPHRE